jgi:hypothetical protein
MHEKIETRIPPRLARTAKAPRKSLGRDDSHSNGISKMKAVEPQKADGDLEVHRGNELDGIEESEAIPAVEPTVVEESSLAAAVSNNLEAQEA